MSRRKRGPPWPTLVVAPREAPEAGCRALGHDRALRCARCDRDERRVDLRDSRASQRGIALVIALWLTVLLTVIASGFAFSMRGEALAARNALVARAGARGRRRRRRTHGCSSCRGRAFPTRGRPTVQPHAWKEGDVDDRVAAVDEAAKIDLNSAHRGAAEGTAGRASAASTPRQPRASLDAILDWRDADDLRRPNGAEEADYRAAGLKVRARQRAVRNGGRAGARVRRDAGAVRAHCADAYRLFAAGRHQCADGLARRAARVADRDRRRSSTPTSQQRARRDGARSCRCRRSRRRRDSRPVPCRSGASAPRPPRPMV